MIGAVVTQLNNFALQCSKGGDFFGFPTWYKYVCGGSNKEVDFKFLPKTGTSDLILVALAVIEIMLRISALLAVGYLVFAGIKYVVSQGDSSKVAEAKGTIINALAGLLIATFSVAMVSFLGDRLGG